MDSGIMARLEVEDPLLACHDQTAGWLNRVCALLATDLSGDGQSILPGKR